MSDRDTTLSASAKGRRLARRGLAALAGLGLSLGYVALAGPAPEANAASYSCPAGMTCIWTGKNAGGSEYRYSYYANHTHQTASIYYNYNTNSISLWTQASGKGTRITGYTTSQRGFRNWDQSNWNICRSHVDRLN